MSLINKGNVTTGNIIEAQDVLNIIEALDGTSDNTTVIATGSFTGSFIGFLYGTSSWAISCSQALLADTASYIDPTFISASAAASGFGAGGATASAAGNTGDVQFNVGDEFSSSPSFSINVGYTSLRLGGGHAPQAQFAFSQGIGTVIVAGADCSHAQGSASVAWKIGAHAEGFLASAAGAYSHAEGYQTQAAGAYSHAEGSGTNAFSTGSHAEGLETIASGAYSHVEGYRTIASASYQHVQGKFNLGSTTEAAFIIGNGTGLASRKNLVLAAGNEFQITGSLLVTGSASIKGLTQSAGNNNVLTYNSTTGLLSYTASSAVGSTGGGSQFTYEIGQLVPSQGGIIGNRWMSGSTQWYIVVEQMAFDPLTTGAEDPALGPIDPARLLWDAGQWTTNRTFMTSSIDGRINCTKATTLTPIPTAGLLLNLKTYYGTVTPGDETYANVNYYWLDSISGYYEDMAVFYDWYIPAILELKALWDNVYKIDETLQRMYYFQSYSSMNNWGAANPLYISEYGSFSDTQMWSSTENIIPSEGTSNVMGINRSTGLIEKITKLNSTRSVRRIRRFSI